LELIVDAKVKKNIMQCNSHFSVDTETTKQHLTINNLHTNRLIL